MGRGAGGRVLSAFEGAKGAAHERIRKQGYVETDSDRVPDLSGISAPVFGADGRLVGALTLTMPTSRKLPGFVDDVRKAARQLTVRLGGTSPR